MSRRPKIALLSSRDVTNQNALEHYSIAKALEMYVGDVIPIQYPKPSTQLFHRLIKKYLKYSRFTNKDIIKKAKINSITIKKLLDTYDYDILFAPQGSQLIAFLDIIQPIVYYTDSTFNLMIDYYHPRNYFSQQDIEQFETIEYLALQNARLVLPSNDWAVKSIVQHYGINKNKVHLNLSGPNLLDIPLRSQLYKEDIKKSIKLLMVGRFWHRKGGDIGLETVYSLIENGESAHLTICGMEPPYSYNKNYVTIIKNIDKNKSRDYEKLIKLYNDSHFLIYPSRAECSGLAMVESNALATPVLATNTGGLSSYVRDGINGFLLPLEQNGSAYANKIINIINNENQYSTLCSTSRNEYETRINWEVWSQKTQKLINSL